MFLVMTHSTKGDRHCVEHLKPGLAGAIDMLDAAQLSLPTCRVATEIADRCQGRDGLARALFL